MGNIGTQDIPTDLSFLPRVWATGVNKATVKYICTSAVVSGGNAVFYLTDNNGSTGSAVFTNVYLESTNLYVSSSTDMYNYSGLTVSGDKKTLTVTVNRLGTVLVGIIQLVTAANGTTVFLQILGD